MSGVGHTVIHEGAVAHGHGDFTRGDTEVVVLKGYTEL